jgi:membrane protein required for colicin V production
LVNIVDPILLVVLSLFALRGYFKGLFRESFSLLGLVIGFMIAVRYDEPLAALWAESWKTSLIVLKLVAFVGLFFAVYFLFSLIGWLLHRSAKFLFLQGINRVGGVVLGAGKGAAILSLGVFLLISSPFVSQQARQKADRSYLVPPLHFLGAELIRVGRTSILPRNDSSHEDGSSAPSTPDQAERDSPANEKGAGYF